MESITRKKALSKGLLITVMFLAVLSAKVHSVEAKQISEDQRTEKSGYVYDKSGRLKEVIYENGKVICYEYDANGNIINITMQEREPEEISTEDPRSTLENENYYLKVFQLNGWNRLQRVQFEKNLTLKQISQLRKVRAVIKNLKASGGGKIKLNIKKIKNVTGYEIKYATNKKFKKEKKVCITGTMKQLRLKSGKKYYIKARGYYINSEGKKINTKYSKVKIIKVK